MAGTPQQRADALMAQLQTLRTDAKLGWVYCITTQTLYATDADGKTILDERKLAAK
jgi:hypothetical protein